ncbi:hypothetical protein GDO78_009663 [Eleutherodactylus coqui]|uniref:Uncharacterized protein n=1 Tax=Eleutherodactylus coqui TaxID=57060 RepID=A0A8J6KCL7_ELECQ|nr:hypothetical protein GDO78_009663 [Eleutherodactylus coqui]
MWVGDWNLTDCPLFTIHKCASGQRHPSPILYKYVPPFLPAVAKGSMSMEAFHSVNWFLTFYMFELLVLDVSSQTKCIMKPA